MKVQQLPTLSKILQSKRLDRQTQGEKVKGWREWYGAIAAVQSLMSSIAQGLVFSSPAPVMNHHQASESTPKGETAITSVVFTPNPSLQTKDCPHLLTFAPTGGEPNNNSSSVQFIPLGIDDPLQNEQFCLVFTREFSLLMVLTFTREGESHFDFSFDPEVTQQAWLSLKPRLNQHSPEQLASIEQQRQQFPLCAPDYGLVSDFTRQLLDNLPTKDDRYRDTGTSNNSPSQDLELLQALTHEVRTPLTTIRMLTRLLLKRKDLGADVQKRLRVIDLECTEQINRMELIFQATELEGKNESKQGVNLTAIPLQDLFANSIPYWKKQAKRRNVELDVILPEQLPTVISHPELLTQVLTGLMENFTSRLPSGGKVQVQVMTVGHQIKLQLLSQSSQPNAQQFYLPKGKSIGQLLTLQPETGSLSLNLNVTKNLFEALGGKLTVRQRSEMGEVLTVFLPTKVVK